MPETEDFRKHLDLIQGIINCLTIKTWSVGLITILGGFAAKDVDPRMACALILPAVCVWGLDAWYLRCERRFRKLYEAVVAKDPDVRLYSLDPGLFEKDVRRRGSSAFAPTVLWLHLPIALFVAGLIVFSFLKHR